MGYGCWAQSKGSEAALTKFSKSFCCKGRILTIFPIKVGWRLIIIKVYIPKLLYDILTEEMANGKKQINKKEFKRVKMNFDLFRMKK